jgi:hexosaminidase
MRRPAPRRYLFAEGGITQWALAAFYWADPEKNLANLIWPSGVYWGFPATPPSAPTYDPSVMVWTLAYIGVTALLARWMYQRRIFVKI